MYDWLTMGRAMQVRACSMLFKSMVRSLLTSYLCSLMVRAWRRMRTGTWMRRVRGAREGILEGAF
jgi:hypothetical protein